MCLHILLEKYPTKYEWVEYFLYFGIGVIISGINNVIFKDSKEKIKELSD